MWFQRSECSAFWRKRGTTSTRAVAAGKEIERKKAVSGSWWRPTYQILGDRCTKTIKSAGCERRVTISDAQVTDQADAVGDGHDAVRCLVLAHADLVPRDKRRLFLREIRTNGLIPEAEFRWTGGRKAVDGVFEEDEYGQTMCQRTKRALL